MDIFSKIKDISELRRSGAINSFAIPSFFLLDVDYYIWDLSKKFLFWTYKHELGVGISETAAKGARKPLIRLTTVDLLENAASLIQYKISSGVDFPTWREFDRWSKRHPAYTRVIDFVRRFLGNDDLAVRMFCPLVQVAFETNRPVQAFAILLGAFKYNFAKGYLDYFIRQRELCRWIDLFDTYMEKIKFDEPELGQLMSKNFFRLDRYATSKMTIGDYIGHPIVGNFAKIWGEFERTNVAYRYAFTAPNGYAAQIREVAAIFRAPIALLKLTVRGENIVLVTGDITTSGLANLSGAQLDEIAIKGGLVEFLTIFGVVRRFGHALMDTNFRLCHHKQCPNYADNYCNSWIFIPHDYKSCGFERHILTSMALTDGVSTSKIEWQLM